MIKTKTSKMMMLASIAVVTVIFGGISVMSINAQEEALPAWIQNVAGFWSNGDVSDSEFVSAMEFLVDQGIMNLPNTMSTAEAQTITGALSDMEQRIEKIETQTPSVSGTTLSAPSTPSVPPVDDVSYSPICPSNMVQHWDKVVFKTTDDTNFLTTNKDIEHKIINTGEEMDMKFRDSPSEVDTLSSIKNNVWNRLTNELGFFETGINGNLQSSDIVIVDVEYAIICAYPPGAVESIPAPMK